MVHIVFKYICKAILGDTSLKGLVLSTITGLSALKATLINEAKLMNIMACKSVLIWSVYVFIGVDCLLGMYVQIPTTTVIILHFLLLYIFYSIFGSILCPFNHFVRVANEVWNNKKKCTVNSHEHFTLQNCFTAEFGQWYSQCRIYFLGYAVYLFTWCVNILGQQWMS